MKRHLKKKTNHNKQVRMRQQSRSLTAKDEITSFKFDLNKKKVDN